MSNADWCKTSINGVLDARLSLDDRGLAYGDGLFETMRVVQGEIPLLSLHLDRLSSGCRALSIEYCLNDIKRNIASLLVCADSQHCVLKLIYTRGDGASGFAPQSVQGPRLILFLRPLPNPAPLPGVRLHRCSMPLAANPLLAGLKHLNRLDYVLAAQSLPKGAAPYGLLCDRQSRVVESLHHNLFILKGRTLLTPSLQESGVKGVMRRYIIEKMGQSCGIEQVLEHTNLTADDVMQADEVFLSNAVRGVIPVRAYESKEWGGYPTALCLQGQIAAIWER